MARNTEKNNITINQLVEKVASWCKGRVAEAKVINESTPFKALKQEWRNRIELWDEINPFVRQTLGIEGLYPDEIAVSETVGGLCGKLIEKMGQPEQAGSDQYRRRKDLLSIPPDKQIEHPTVFVLSSPRSGSTLFRIMLAGHSDLNAPPELHLIGHNSMRSRERFFAETGNTWRLYGLVQTLASQMSMSEDQVFAMLTKLTVKDIPIYRVYELIHSSSNKSILVDKSPSIVRLKARMDQAEQMFKEPKFIHLVRHPGAVIESLDRMRNIIKTRVSSGKEDRLTRLKLFESDWREQNGITQEFLSGIPADRKMRVQYDGLVRDPKTVMQRVTDFIGVDYEGSMIDPYSGDRLMAGVGDPNITSRNKVDPLLVDSWKENLGYYVFENETLGIASQLGIDI